MECSHHTLGTGMRACATIDKHRLTSKTNTTTRNKQKANISKLHLPGFEPGSQGWQRCMIPLHYRCHIMRFAVRFSRITVRVETGGVFFGVPHYQRNFDFFRRNQSTTIATCLLCRLPQTGAENRLISSTTLMDYHRRRPLRLWGPSPTTKNLSSDTMLRPLLP